MAHIPMETVEYLWEELGSNKSWNALHQHLKDHQPPERMYGRPIDEDTIYTLLWEIKNLEIGDEPFPETPEQFFDLINARVKNQGFQESPGPEKDH